jgi:regulator of nucleoside diphosphate kinase
MHMNSRTIHVTRQDLQRLRHVVGSAASHPALNRQHLDALTDALDRAVVVDADEISPDVIRMHTRARVRDRQSGEVEHFTLVYPWEADVQFNLISVLAPLGTALLGRREGARVRWLVPGGERELTVEEIFRHSGSAAPAPHASMLASHSSM